LAGVLTETGFTGGRLDFVVVGIGINVNVQPEVLPRLAPNAASILGETGRPTDRATLVAATLNGIEARYERLRTGETPHAEWSARLATLGRRVQVRTSEGMIAGIAERVDESGALLLRTLDGERHTLTVGDVIRAHAPGA
jgi:BirA family biotin operon repressor/biotin-[acetyl-CoA-carboxylase] ligase